MVVYNLSYKVYVSILDDTVTTQVYFFRDEASAKLFRETGVEIRRHVLPPAP